MTGARYQIAVDGQPGYAGEVRARPVQAGDKTQCNRVTASAKNDGYGRGSLPLPPPPAGCRWLRSRLRGLLSQMLS
jgi:hypothetical protein